MHEFPLYISLEGNNSTVFGGGESAAAVVRELQRFHTRITVVSPQLCTSLAEADKNGVIRHIPRKYFRGDCNNSQLCIAATSDDAVNIAIATECKAKSIPVHVVNSHMFGSFQFPKVIEWNGILISMPGDIPQEKFASLLKLLQQQE